VIEAVCLLWLEVMGSADMIRPILYSYLRLNIILDVTMPDASACLRCYLQRSARSMPLLTLYRQRHTSVILWHTCSYDRRRRATNGTCAVVRKLLTWQHVAVICDRSSAARRHLFNSAKASQVIAILLRNNETHTG
jgi:hypothetical protein